MPRSRLARVACITLLTLAVGCGEDEPLAPEPAPVLGPTLSDAVSSNCYTWPEVPFSRESHARIFTALEPGARAVGFTLRNVHGTPYDLQTLLASKPVLLVLGSHT